MLRRLREIVRRLFGASADETATITVTHDGVVQGQVVVTLDAPAPTDPTLGTTTVGSSAQAFLANVKRVNSYSLTQSAAVSKMRIYLEPSATGTSDLKGVIYADSSGAPGALMAVSSELAFADTNAAGWYDMPFASPVTLSAGAYWIGVITGGTSGVAGYRYASVANSRRYNNNSYTSGPTDPFGTGTADDQQMSIYAVYTVSDPPPPPPANAPVFYAPDSLWNQPVAADAPRDPNEAAIVANLLNQINTNPNGISSATSGVPIYTVPASQPLVKVAYSGGQKGLQAALSAVPLPDNAQPSVGGTDQRLVLHQPSTDTVWEFWRLAGGPGTWSCGTGGRMYYQSQDPGYFRNVQSPSGEILEQPDWGGVACSLGMAGGAILIAECQAGSINHALCMALNNCRNDWAAPCQRTDGTSTDPSSPPEGAHFRLDPNLDIPSLGLKPFAEMLALAMQKYGWIINNRTGAGQALRAEDPAQYIAAYGYNPWNGGPNPLFGGQTPAQILSPSTFPWQHAQLLKMTLRTTADNTLYIQTPPS